MKSQTPFMITISSFIAGLLIIIIIITTTSSSSILVNAQQTTPTIETTTTTTTTTTEKIITTCPPEQNTTCATTQNRTCYAYETTTADLNNNNNNNQYECGYCLFGHFEFQNECYDIDIIDDGKWIYFSKLLELYLPDYIIIDNDIDPAVISTEERARALEKMVKVVSFWNSRVPPPEFTLGLNEESLLTPAEEAGRLGIDLSNEGITYDYREDEVGKRGKMKRFKVGNDDEDDDEDGDEDGDDSNDEGKGRMRGLAVVSSSVTTTTDTAKKEGRRKLENTGEVPSSSIDWASQGYTTVIKNQGLCGCCWAVATAGAVESALMITNQTKRYDSDGINSLSFQQMISCDDEEKGCKGGNILLATRYVWENNNFDNEDMGGLLSSVDWPYTDYLGKTSTECKAQELKAQGATPAAYLNFPKIVNSVNDRSDFDERKERLMAAVAQQPVISVLKSNCDILKSYTRGVLTHDNGCECSDVSCIDHAIVIVGYDTTAPTPYWKLRNSWGGNWGEEGHFRIAMNNPGVGEWGLFGCLAEAALPSDAYKNLSDLSERPGWWETAAGWEKTMVILSSILVCCCLCGCLGAVWNKRSEMQDAA